MAEFVVEVDGKAVYTGTADRSQGIKGFPPEWRGRPESGERALLIDGEVIATMRTRDEDDLAVAAWRAAEREERIAFARQILRAEGVES